MSKQRFLRLTALALCFWVSPFALAQKPIWARQAVPFNFNCTENSAKSQKIPSPDGKVTAEVKCRSHCADADPTYFLHVAGDKVYAQDIDLDEGAHERLRSPDSKAFFVDGEITAISGFFVTVYQIDDHSVQNLTVTDPAQQDMVTGFPPCKAYFRDETLCKQIEKTPGYNMTGLSWENGSSKIIVMAEVPCSSEYGGIMCQVLGYELSVPTGKILRRMTAAELKEQWQKSILADADS